MCDSELQLAIDRNNSTLVTLTLGRFCIKIADYILVRSIWLSQLKSHDHSLCYRFCLKLRTIKNGRIFTAATKLPTKLSHLGTRKPASDRRKSILSLVRMEEWRHHCPIFFVNLAASAIICWSQLATSELRFDAVWPLWGAVKINAMRTIYKTSEAFKLNIGPKPTYLAFMFWSIAHIFLIYECIDLMQNSLIF